MIKNYFSYYSQKFASKWLVFAIDLTIVTLTLFIAYFVRFNFTLNFDIGQFLIQVPLLLCVAAVSFLVVGSFKSVIRHTGFADVVNVFKSVVLMIVLTTLIVLVNAALNIIEDFTIPKSILVTHALFSFVALSGCRLIFKIAYNHLKLKLTTTRNVMIYGAGDSGIILIMLY